MNTWEVFMILWNRFLNTRPCSSQIHNRTNLALFTYLYFRFLNAWENCDL